MLLLMLLFEQRLATRRESERITRLTRNGVMCLLPCDEDHTLTLGILIVLSSTKGFRMSHIALSSRACEALRSRGPNMPFWVQWFLPSLLPFQLSICQVRLPAINDHMEMAYAIVQ